MSELSRTAQAVLDTLCVDELNGSQQLVARAYAAAALRATALIFRTEMKGSVSNGFVRGVLAAATALEEIASELEAQ